MTVQPRPFASKISKIMDRSHAQVTRYNNGPVTFVRQRKGAYLAQSDLRAPYCFVFIPRVQWPSAYTLVLAL